MYAIIHHTECTIDQHNSYLSGQYAFLLPEEQIIPVGEELFAAVKVVAEQILEEENQADNFVTTKETDIENFATNTENPVNIALTLSSVQPQQSAQLFCAMVYVLCYNSWS